MPCTPISAIVIVSAGSAAAAFATASSAAGSIGVGTLLGVVPGCRLRVGSVKVIRCWWRVLNRSRIVTAAWPAVERPSSQPVISPAVTSRREAELHGPGDAMAGGGSGEAGDGARLDQLVIAVHLSEQTDVQLTRSRIQFGQPPTFTRRFSSLRR